jgi:hypothetical protein
MLEGKGGQSVRGNIRQQRMLTAPPCVHNRYNDSHYEYRHVQLPKAMLKAIPKDYHDSSKGTLKLLWEDEWRALGITQVSLVHHTEPTDDLGRGDQWRTN